MNNLIRQALVLPVRETVQTVSISPVVLPAPERGQPLEMRITAPIAGADLPIILLSHGDGPSLYLPSKDGYGPLANFYAEQGSRSSNRPMPIRRSQDCRAASPARPCSGARGCRR